METMTLIEFLERKINTEGLKDNSLWFIVHQHLVKQNANETIQVRDRLQEVNISDIRPLNEIKAKPHKPKNSLIGAVKRSGKVLWDHITKSV